MGQASLALIAPYPVSHSTDLVACYQPEYQKRFYLNGLMRPNNQSLVHCPRNR